MGIKQYREADNGMDVGGLPYFATWKQKKAKDFQIAKDLASYYLMAVPDHETERQSRIDTNVGIYNGRWEELENMNPDLSFSVGNDHVNLKGAKLRYYPYADQILRAVVAEMGLKPFVPMLVDKSSKGTKKRQRLHLEKIGKWLQTSVLDQERKRISQTYMMENGIQDPYSLSPEQQQQVQADMQRRIEDQTEELERYLKLKRIPVEEVGQTFLRHLMDEQDMFNKFIDGWRDGITTGEEYHRVWVPNHKPVHESLNVKFVEYGGSQDTEYVEDGEWASYRQIIRLTELLGKYKVERKDAEKLKELYEPLRGNSNTRDPEPDKDIQRRILHDISRGKIDQSKIDWKTREGQGHIRELYKEYGNNSNYNGGGVGFGIPENYVVWKWTRNIQEVTRIENNKKKKYYVDEYYEPSELKGDYEVKKYPVPQVWHAVEFGNQTGIYGFCKPVDYQYNDITNPFDTKLTIYGGKYNRQKGNAKNIALVDPAKPWIYRYCVQMKRVEEFESTNIGRVLLGTANMKPDGWTWQQFFSSLRFGKFAPVNTHGEHVSGIDAQFFKSIDLSNMMDVAATLEALQRTEQQIARSMHYNPSKLGIGSPYITANTNQQNIQASDRQLYEYYRKHTNIRNRVLQGMLNLARVTYSDNEVLTSVMLDDFQIAAIETDPEALRLSKLHLKVVDDFKEYEKMKEIQQGVAQFIMNGHGELEDFVKVMQAEDNATIMRIAEEATLRMKKNKRQEQQSQQQMMEAQKQLEKQMLQFKGQQRLAEIETEGKWRMKSEEVANERYANQFDIDRNKVNDKITEREMIINHEKDMKERDIDLERYKVDKRVQTELEKEKLKQMK